MIRRRTLLLYGASLAALGIADAALAAAARRGGPAAGRAPGAKGEAGPGENATGHLTREVNASNILWLRDASGMGAHDYPVRIGRPFVQGEIAGAPQAVVTGAKVPTQADIKTRWPDGSVKHAILSFVVAQIPSGGRVAVTFANQPVVADEAMTREQMLDRAFDFEAVMQITRDAKMQTASARTMLTNGDYSVWCKGPISTTIILADHSQARKYDIGFEPGRPVRPIFHATFWPDLHKVQMRVIGENSNTEALQDVTYALAVRSGLTAPKEIFRQDEVPHSSGTRWTRSFWIGGEPNPEIDIDHNIAYLTKTYAFPNFDPTFGIPEPVISQTYAKYQASQRNLYDSGPWQRAMNATGGRDDIGPYTAQNAKWLLSGDHRMLAVVSGMADLACAWAMHVREGDAKKLFDRAGKVPALGRPVSVNARPTLWLFDARGNTKPEDKVEITGDRIRGGKRNIFWLNWHDDGAHQPDPYSALYTLTGDYFALEQLQFWAAASVLRYDPGYKGPAPSGAILDEVRGKAWVLRNRAHAAFLSPDGSPEKAYFEAMIGDAIAFWEGMLGITGTPAQNSALWSFAKQNRSFQSPLHFWQDRPLRATQRNNAQTTSSSVSLWEQYMLMFELGVAKEKGFRTGPLLTYTSYVLTSQFQEPKTYSVYNLQRYSTGVKDTAGNFFRTWTETLASYQDPQPEEIKADVCDGYATYAYGASTVITNEPGGAVAYKWLKDRVYESRRDKYGRCPKWAFVPRA